MTRQLVLIHASEDDRHADAVARRLRGMGAPVETLIDERFGKDWFVTDGADEVVVSKGELRWGRDEIRTVFWREDPPAHDLPGTALPHPGLDPSAASGPKARGLRRLCRERPFVNDLEADRTARCRDLQERVAASVGLNIRRVYDGSDPSQAEDFAHRMWAEGRGCAQEAVGSSLGQDPRTPSSQPLLPHDLARLGERGPSPLRLREVLDRLYDYRVTAVGEELFVCRLYPSAGGVEARCEAAVLPREVESQVQELRRRLGLVYATADLVETRDHKLYFVRANGMGQWLWVESLTDLPITEAVAKQLLRPSHPSGLVPAA